VDVGRNGILQNSNSGEPDDTSVIFHINNNREYYAIGIRNSFGIAVDPITGYLWDTENGDNFYDEINLVMENFNSGWKKVMGPATKEQIENFPIFKDFSYSNPEFSWEITVAPTGISFINSDQFLEFKNSLLVGDFNNGNLYEFKLNEDRSGFVFSNPNLSDLVANREDSQQELIIGTGFGGITDIEVGADGLIYIVSITDGAIYRIIPAEKDIQGFVKSTCGDKPSPSIDLSFCDLSGSNFQNTNLAFSNLSFSNLTEVNLQGAILSSVNFTGANLSGSNLTNAKLTNSILVNTNLNKADLTKAKMNSVILDNSLLNNAKMTQSLLKGSYIVNSSLKNVDLTNTDMRRILLIDSNLEGANISDAVLHQSHFENVNLKNADLTKIKGKQVLLKNVNLEGATLHQTNLENSILINSNLMGANLNQTNFLGSSIENVEFDGAIFYKTQLPTCFGNTNLFKILRYSLIQIENIFPLSEPFEWLIPKLCGPHYYIEPLKN